MKRLKKQNIWLDWEPVPKYKNSEFNKPFKTKTYSSPFIFLDHPENKNVNSVVIVYDYNTSASRFNITSAQKFHLLNWGGVDLLTWCHLDYQAVYPFQQLWNLVQLDRNTMATPCENLLLINFTLPRKYKFLRVLYHLRKFHSMNLSGDTDFKLCFP